MANYYAPGAGTYKEIYETALQQRLNYPTNWKQVCRLIMSDKKIVNAPYMSTVPGVQSHTRGTYFSWQSAALTNQTLDIATSYYAATYIDHADLAQCQYAKIADIATLHAQTLYEQVETAVLATYGSFTDFDDGIVTSNANNNTGITIGTDNIDDVCGAMKREIMEANGWNLAGQNGMFIIWRASDFEKLEAWARANGYTTADDIIVNGMKVGVKYLGIEHYQSNKHTTGHLFGGVKNLLMLGILKDTFGRMYEYTSPSDGDGNLSGIGIHARIDYGITVPTNYLPLLFDIQVDAGGE